MSVADVLQKARAPVDTASMLVTFEGQTEPAILALPTAYDILTTTFQDPAWIVDDYLPAGLGILAGRPKIGKSWMGFQLALAVASGGMALGKRVVQGKVLYLALEDSHRRLQERMKLQGWTLEASKQVTMLTLDEFRKYIGYLHKEGAARLSTLIEAEKYRLVVVDTLARAFIGVKDMNDSQQVTEALSPIQHLSIESNCLTLLLDHHGKPRGYNPNPIDDVMSSTAKSAVADTVLGLYRDNSAQSHQLMMIGRDVGELTLPIRWDRLTCCWQVIDAQDKKLTPNQAAALIYLKGVKKASLSEIARALEIPLSNCSQHVTDRLVLLEMIERDEDKQYHVVCER
jgi:hypothetical protein